MLEEMDKKIIASLQDDLPLVKEPYREIAGRLGITEEMLLQKIKKYCESGIIRKMGAVLRHREVGFAANALCAWVVPDERIDEVGETMAAHPSVTHCYARVTAEGWPYNFYTMIHAHTRSECEELAAELARQAKLDKYTMLFSTRELKKTSMYYFSENI